VVRACPNVEAVFYERFNESLLQPDQVGSERADYRRIRSAVESAFDSEPMKGAGLQWLTAISRATRARS
jgi:hypothetical protein